MPRLASFTSMRSIVLVMCAALANMPGAAAAASPSGDRAQAAASGSLPRPVRLARNDAAHSRHLRAAQVRVVSFKRTTWPDGCLGLGGAGVMCTQQLVAGYRAVFTVRGRRVVYRTDLHGTYRAER
jgi:hypothetical protein